MKLKFSGPIAFLSNRIGDRRVWCVSGVGTRCLPDLDILWGFEMKIRFTEHAVERFIERIARGSSRNLALRQMQRLINDGKLLKEKTQDGDNQLLSNGVIFVLKYDRDDGQADCTTILFDRRISDTNKLAQEIERYGVMPLEMVTPRYRRSKKSRRRSRNAM